MKLERSDVDFPLWRKKVDKSLFEHQGTTIPGWACEMWGVPEEFGEVTSKRDPSSRVTIGFEKGTYEGQVTKGFCANLRREFRLAIGAHTPHGPITLESRGPDSHLTWRV